MFPISSSYMRMATTLGPAIFVNFCHNHFIFTKSETILNFGNFLKPCSRLNYTHSFYRLNQLPWTLVDRNCCLGKFALEHYPELVNYNRLGTCLKDGNFMLFKHLVLKKFSKLWFPNCRVPLFVFHQCVVKKYFQFAELMLETFPYRRISNSSCVLKAIASDANYYFFHNTTIVHCSIHLGFEKGFDALVQHFGIEAMYAIKQEELR